MCLWQGIALAWIKLSIIIYDKEFEETPRHWGGIWIEKGSESKVKEFGCLTRFEKKMIPKITSLYINSSWRQFTDRLPMMQHTVFQLLHWTVQFPISSLFRGVSNKQQELLPSAIHKSEELLTFNLKMWKKTIIIYGSSLTLLWSNQGCKEFLSKKIKWVKC